MNNQEILQVAMRQSAIDFNCSINNFINKGNTVTLSKSNEGRKKCYDKPLFCGLAFYGKGLVATVDDSIKTYIESFINRHSEYRCFDTPQLNVLNTELNKYHKCVCHIAEFFLPDVEKHVSLNDQIEVKILTEKEIPTLFNDDRFHMALGYNNNGDKKDVIAAVGYLDGKIVGVAGASNDCQTMWQMGIDVIPEYRCLGIATTLTKRLTDEILSLGIVPYYCTAWSNIASKNNAIKSGYKSAWIEMAAKDLNFALNMIGENYNA
ncbi:MAG: GCN5-related N-acetyltransferase [Anaerocolumna sp.]|jgi:hypothetical protein|nr:GCN5-related N-acetyltransferase [Anaerocolumna sp.]